LVTAHLITQLVFAIFGKIKQITSQMYLPDSDLLVVMMFDQVSFSSQDTTENILCHWVWKWYSVSSHHIMRHLTHESPHTQAPDTQESPHTQAPDTQVTRLIQYHQMFYLAFSVIVYRNGHNSETNIQIFNIWYNSHGQPSVLRWRSHSVICSLRPGGSADENKVPWMRICRRGSSGMEPVTVLHPQLFVREQFQDGSENISVCI